MDGLNQLSYGPDRYDFLAAQCEIRLVMDLDRYCAVAELAAAQAGQEVKAELVGVVAAIADQPVHVSIHARLESPDVAAFWLFTVGMWTDVPPPEYLPRYGAERRLTGSVPSLDVGATASLVEDLFFENLSSSFFFFFEALLHLDFNIDLNRRVEGRYAASPAFYCYDLARRDDASSNADVSTILRRHLLTFSSRTAGTAASIHSGSVHIVRRELERADMYRPMYLLTFDSGGDAAAIGTCIAAISRYLRPSWPWPRFCGT